MLSVLLYSCHLSFARPRKYPAQNKYFYLLLLKSERDDQQNSIWSPSPISLYPRKHLPVLVNHESCFPASQLWVYLLWSWRYNRPCYSLLAQTSSGAVGGTVDSCLWHPLISTHTGKKKWLSPSGFYFVVDVLSIPTAATASLFKCPFLGFCSSWLHRSFSNVNTKLLWLFWRSQCIRYCFKTIVTKARSWEQSLISRFKCLPGLKDYIYTLSLKFIFLHSGQKHTSEQECSAEGTSKGKIQPVTAGRAMYPGSAQVCISPEERASLCGPAQTCSNHPDCICLVPGSSHLHCDSLLTPLGLI